MTNAKLVEQFQCCQESQDANQWFLLACAYLERGYTMNAVFCFRQSEACAVMIQEAIPA